MTFVNLGAKNAGRYLYAALGILFGFPVGRYCITLILVDFVFGDLLIHGLHGQLEYLALRHGVEQAVRLLSVLFRKLLFRVDHFVEVYKFITYLLRARYPWSVSFRESLEGGYLTVHI